MSLDRKERQDFINSFVAHIFAEKFNPKKFTMNLSSVFEDTNLSVDVEKHWNERNKQIEKKVYQEFGSNAAKEIKQIAEQKQRKFDGYYKFARSMEGVSEADVKNWLPADKLLFNQDIFHNRLRGLDLRTIDSCVERRILQSLQKDAKALSKQEVLLYYSLIKANKLAVSEEQSKIKRHAQENKFFKTLGSALLGLIYPKRINGRIISDINEGVKIDRESIRDNLIDKIQNNRFSPYPYLLLFGVHKNDRMFSHFVSMANLIKYLGQDTETLINYALFYILFKNSDENFLKICNIQPSVMDFFDAKSSKDLSIEGFAMVILLDTFFYVLCTQIFEINRNYQKAGETKKAKIYKLYSAEDRLRMIVTNSLSIAFKAVQRMGIDATKLLATVTRYIEKEKNFLKKEDIFASVFDFEKMAF